jgi:hypothetical protein
MKAVVTNSISRDEQGLEDHDLIGFAAKKPCWFLLTLLLQ